MKRDTDFFFLFFILMLPFSIIAQGDVKNPTGQSLYGFSGLIYTPTAYTSSWGDVYFGHTHFDREIRPTPYGTGKNNILETERHQRSHWTHIGFLPFAELSIKLTKGYNFESTDYGLGDRSISLKVQVLKETEKWPAIAIGVIDPFIEVPIFAANYIVTSKSFQFKDFKIIGNLGYGLDVYKRFDDEDLVGIFGGMQANWKSVKLNIEYDADRVNVGTGYAFKNWLFIDASLINLKYFSGSVHARFSIK